MMKPVGLLTLQGDFEKHRQAFAALGCETRGVRRPEELDTVSCLVIPGGESTTLSRLIDRVGLRQSLCDFAAEHPVMGTCAGLIMLAQGLAGEAPSDFGVITLGLLACTVQRNGFGRQIDSFTGDVEASALVSGHDPLPAVFIRAPRITKTAPQVEVVATWRGEPVAVRQNKVLGLTFHPELTSDLRVHQAFLAMR